MKSISNKVGVTKRTLFTGASTIFFGLGGFAAGLFLAEPTLASLSGPVIIGLGSAAVGAVGAAAFTHPNLNN